MNDSYIVDLLSALDQKRSQKQVNADIKTLEKTINMLRLTASLAQGSSKKEINAYIKTLSNQLSTIKLKAQIDSKNLKSEISKALNNVSFKDIDVLNIDENKTKLKVQKVIADTKSFVEKNPISVGINYEMRRNKLDNDLTAYLNRNSKINKSSVLLSEANKVRDLIGAINDKKSLSEATDSFRLFKSEVASTGYNTQSTTDKIKSMLGHVTKISSAFGVASLATKQFIKSAKELKEIDTLLTEISKANEKLSKSDLNKIGDSSFGVASKYGRQATDYLLGVQEASRAGYGNATDIAELSVAAQGAGDMTAKLANQYLIATDKAYKFGGSVEKLTEVLDGSNYITNHNAVNMTELAESMSIVGSTAASFGVDVDKATAVLGTMIATTQQSGSEVARAFKAILLNIRQVSDEEEGIDAEGLTKYESACNALNVKLKETKNGVLSLRDPMEVLKELSVEYNKLEETDIRRTNLLSSIGGKLRATQLDALLRQWNTYETMLQQYAEGTGSMEVEAEKTAKSLEGRLNSLSNTFISFVNTITNKDVALNGISFFDKMIQGTEGLVNTFGTIPTVLTAINTSLVAMNKNSGITKIWDKENRKIDVEGNIFGIIDISRIKNLKKHYSQASEEMKYWNKELRSGKADLDSFSGSLVKNSEQFKAYLQTTSKDAPASLNGYKNYLKSTGQATEDLRLKTILLNTALTMIGSIAVQAIITGIAQAFDKFNDTVVESKQRIDDVNSKISDLKAQIEELNNLEYKSEFDNQKISQLERELELQEKILEVEQKRLYQNQVGTKFSDYFDEDSLVSKKEVELDRRNKEGYTYLSLKFKADKSSIDDIESEIESLQDQLANGALNGYEDEAEMRINQLIEDRNELLEKQQTIEDQLTVNAGKYLENYETAKEAVESGLLTGDDLEKAESMAEYWNSLYQDSVNIVTNIQKMRGTYDNTNDLLEERFGNISRDDLASLSDDEKRIALSFDPNNDIGFEELKQQIAETKGDVEGLNATEISITPTLSSSVEQIARQLEPQFAKLGDAYKEIFTADGFTLDDVDNSMLEDLRKSFAEIEEEVGVAFDASVLNPFFDTLTNKSSTVEQVQEAFNNLATAYFYSTETLEHLTSGTADAIEKQLEEMGVQNSAEVVAEALTAKTEELIVAKEYLAQTGKELAAATEQEQTAFILEQIEAGNCGEALALLQLKKLLVNSAQINTSADIQQIMNLASAAGMGAEVLTQLANAKSILGTVEAGGNVSLASYEKALSDVESAKQTMLDWKPVELDFSNVGGGASKAGGAGKDAGDAYVDAFEEELKDLQRLRDSGVIDEKEYLDRLRALYQKYFKDKKKYAEQYAKYERQYLEGMKSLYDSALSGISKLMSSQIDGYNDAKEAAVSSLTEEKEARLAVIDAQKEQLEAEQDLIDEQIKEKQKIIDGIQKEIDAMKEAREERQRQLDLQKAQYELERMMHQRTILQYSEDKGMHYINDSSGARSAKEKVDDAKFEIEIAKKEKEIKLIEEEIDLLEEQKDAIQDQIDALDKQADSIEKYYSKMISEQEKYFDSLISNMEKQKSKWEELAEIEEIAKAYSAIEQVFGDMGYTVQDILNGNEQAFEDFKSKYISLMNDMNSNASFAEGLSYATGVAEENLGSFLDKTKETADGISDLSAKGSELNTVTEGMGGLAESATTANANTGELATSMGELGTNTEGISDNLTNINDALNGLPEAENINAISDAFTNMGEAIKSVADALGVGEEGTVGGLVGALQSLSEISLGEMGGEGQGGGTGIVSQFQALKTAVDDVTNAISGGGSSGSTGGGDASNSSSSSMSAGAGGEGASGLVGAIESFKSATDEALGSGGEEGEGSDGGGSGAIGQFGQLKEAVDEVTTAIGSGDSEGGSGDGGDEEAANLIGAINNLGETTEEILAGGGESGGESGGVIGRFEEFKDVIGEANEHVTGISEGLAAIDGQEVECTIKVNIETTGGLPAGLAHSTGTALDTMKLESAEYNAKYLGNAHVEGTALTSGDWAVQSDEQSALVGELGYEIVVRNGRFFTVGNAGPEMFPIKKGDIVFNHEQSVELLKNGRTSGRGKAYADGTVGGGKVLTKNGAILRPLQPGDKMYDMVQKFDAYFKSMDGNLEKLVPNSFYEHQKQMEDMAKQINYVSSVTNNNRNMQPVVNHINVTCPGVTSQQVAEQIGSVLGKELNKKFSGMHLEAEQRSRIR